VRPKLERPTVESKPRMINRIVMVGGARNGQERLSARQGERGDASVKTWDHD